MDSMDLSRLDGGDGVRRGLAARFDEAMRRDGIVVLERHGLDTELLELAGTFGRRLLAHAELREVFAEHRVAMLGVAQRVLALAGVALGQSPALFADRFSGAPRVEFTLQESAGAPPKGLLGLRQEANGRVLAWIGPQFTRVAAERYPLPQPPALSRGALALRLDLASPLLDTALSFAPTREISPVRPTPGVVHRVAPLPANRATPVINAT
jgi:hypothetical protein